MEQSTPRSTMPPREYLDKDDMGGAPPPPPATTNHVGDECDSTWHNPACAKPAGTWAHSCVFNTSTGQYVCSHTS
jgi:hypothetical protein